MIKYDLGASWLLFFGTYAYKVPNFERFCCQIISYLVFVDKQILLNIF